MQLSGTLCSTKVYSFDVFDTLVTRSVGTPAGVFSMMQTRLCEIPQCRLLQDFVNRRIAAEKIARRQTNREEVRLSEIYTTLCDLNGLPEAAKPELMQLEIAIEHEVILPVVQHVSEINQLLADHKRVILISDMYHSAETISGLLRQAVPEIVDHCQLYVSSDVGRTKASGRLFKHILEKEGIVADEMLHVGDNKFSDVDQPRRLGIQTNASTLCHLTSWERLGEDEHDSRWQARAGNARWARLNSGNIRSSIGYAIAGPILFGFVDWVLQRAAEQKLKKLCFLARDGFVLREIAVLLADKHGFVPEQFHYVYGSRSAWQFAASANYIETSAFDWVLETTKNPTLAEVARRLQLDVTDLREWIQCPSLDQLNPLSPLTRRQNAQIANALGDAAVASKIRNSASEQAELLRRYLKPFAPSSDQPWALVDVGWKGTMQDALYQILNHGDFKCDIVGFYFGLRRQNHVQLNGAKHSFLNDHSDHEEGLVNALDKFIEQFATAVHGSTLRYQEGTDGVVMPVLDAQGMAIAQWGHQFLFDGILEFAKDHAVETRELGLQSLSEAMQLIRGLDKFVVSNRLCKVFAECMGSIPFCSDSGTVGLKELAPKCNAVTAFRYLFASQKSRNGITLWLQGSVARSGWFVRLIMNPYTECISYVLRPWRFHVLIPVSLIRRFKSMLPRLLLRQLERGVYGRVISN